MNPPSERFDLGAYDVPTCSLTEDGCLTCGDVAVPVTVVRAGNPDAVCVDDYGNEGKVAVELVESVDVGDRLLMHAGVAIQKLVEP